MGFAGVGPNVMFGEELNPVVAIGDPVFLLGNQGPAATADGYSGLFEVTHIEAIPALGPRGIIVVWSDTAVPTGYTADQNATVAHIAAGGNAQCNPVNMLKLVRDQFAQIRIRPKFFATVTGAVDDYDVVVGGPPQALRWAFLNQNGVINAVGQAQDPGDSIVMPAQGANITLPAVYPNESPWRFANRSELFLLEDASIRVQINNNGSAITSGGAVGIQVAGFVYNISPLPLPDGPRGIDGKPTKLAKKLHLAGYDVMVPNYLNQSDVTILPTAIRQP